jgi:ABC-2 type transport system ATP-binding protein/lipopolysaccharide transport system ATP-binding protein
MGDHPVFLLGLPVAHRLLGLKETLVASILLENVSVSFPDYSSSTRTLKNRLIQSATGGQIRADGATQRISIVQALQNINLSLKSGDRIGLVGHNGAGKTTLLRVLGGIYEPNCGHVSIHGSTVPLFDIGLGMNQESTGYENIILRGLFLGLTRQQIKSRLDEIAEFTELGDFLDLPIRTYSAGMQMRLAFAVSTSVVPDILLLDEGIGAGDASFLQKARERLKRFTDQVSIIVLSSHSEELISGMCSQALLMEHGQIVKHGPTEEVLALYRAMRGVRFPLNLVLQG